MAVARRRRIPAAGSRKIRFGLGVTVASTVEIKGFCDIEGARIARGCIIGPFARIRPGSVVADKVHIGNFVEVKNSSLGEGAKANHLAYVGDATVGARANIGAGTITANYDGANKHRTVLEDDVHIAELMKLHLRDEAEVVDDAVHRQLRRGSYGIVAIRLNFPPLRRSTKRPSAVSIHIASRSLLLPVPNRPRATEPSRPSMRRGSPLLTISPDKCGNR